MYLIFPILILIALALAFPTGYLIAFLTKDELVYGRKWLGILSITAMGLGFFLVIFGLVTESITLIFIAIVALVSYLKAGDKKFVNSRSSKD